MSRNRLFSLLIALSLVVLALTAAPPAAQADVDCSQFNTGSCVYYWYPEATCCAATGRNCIWVCW